ncbi:MAG: dihydrodipicolinate synthase family protein [Candidatus Thermoplasmatota archaeon]|nr:dihydrodipicolinate synthase family protein [Candidatus Thermoplasmatota archaeon]
MKFRGIITPMLTPFKPDGTIDFDATKTLIEYLKGIGVTGLFPCGSTGLFPFLSVEEKKAFLKYVVENAAGLKVLAGVGSSSTQEAIELGKYAGDIGADALVLMPTYYITPGQPEIIKHFSDFITEVKKEVFLYNIPQLCGVRIETDTVAKLKTEFSEVIGLKESSADMRYFSSIMDFSGPDFSILQGQDDLLVPSLSIGADGGVCGLSNFSSAVINAYNEFTTGIRDKAAEVQKKTDQHAPENFNGFTFSIRLLLRFLLKIRIEEWWIQVSHDRTPSLREESNRRYGQFRLNSNKV